MEIKETLDATLIEQDGNRKINQYVLKKQLGAGSFGVVHLAQDTDLQRMVAIKECSKSKLKKQQSQAQGAFPGRGRGRGGIRGGTKRRVTITRASNAAPPSNPLDLVKGEIAILKKLNHPNIVKLYEVLDDPSQDSLFMVFELCEKGAVLDVSMDKDVKPLSAEAARNYFRQLVLGIEYLHEHDIAHRDIKPDNMLISKDGVVKIVDFGVSEMFSKGNDKFKKTAGSPAFYAPEQCGLSHADNSAMAADIWAMGVTLYCMVFGKLPFISKSIIGLYDAIRDDEVPYPADVEPRLLALLKKLLEKDPYIRIEMSDLKNDEWLTDSGRSPLMTTDENCGPGEILVTQSDIDAAVKHVGNVFTVLKAAQKLKKLGIQNHERKQKEENDSISEEPSASIQANNMHKIEESIPE